MNKLLFVILYRLHIKLQPYYHKKYQSSLTPCYPNTVIFSHTYIEGAALIKSIIYKDNEWNHIKHISKFMWNDLYRNRFLQYTNKEDFIDNICPENKIQRKGETIVCESHNQINDWIFLRIPIQGQTTYSFEFKAIIHSVNTEFQLAFNYQSISKRYRSNLVNNRELNFDIINDGFFLNSLMSTPLSLEIGVQHEFKLINTPQNIQYIIDQNIVMSLRLEKPYLTHGDIALIAWDSQNSNIKVEYSDLKIKI